MWTISPIEKKNICYLHYWGYFRKCIIFVFMWLFPTASTCLQEPGAYSRGGGQEPGAYSRGGGGPGGHSRGGGVLLPHPPRFRDKWEKRKGRPRKKREL